MDEEEDHEFPDILIEFDNMDGQTDKNWTGRLMFREEFETLMDWDVESDAEEMENWGDGFDVAWLSI